MRKTSVRFLWSLIHHRYNTNLCVRRYPYTDNRKGYRHYLCQTYAHTRWRKPHSRRHRFSHFYSRKYQGFRWWNIFLNRFRNRKMWYCTRDRYLTRNGYRHHCWSSWLIRCRHEKVLYIRSRWSRCHRLKDWCGLYNNPILHGHMYHIQFLQNMSYQYWNNYRFWCRRDANRYLYFRTNCMNANRLTRNRSCECSSNYNLCRLYRKSCGFPSQIIPSRSVRTHRRCYK